MVNYKHCTDVSGMTTALRGHQITLYLILFKCNNEDNGHDEWHDMARTMD